MADQTKSGDGDQQLAEKSGKRGIVLILAGIVVTGIIAGYSWLKGLPKD